MKFQKILASVMALSLILTGCASKETATTSATSQTEATTSAPDNSAILEGAVEIALSDDGIKVDGNAIATEETSAVYGANDIVYYMSGQDFKYGEGTEKDAHSEDEAAAHTVVHITQPGRYAVSGKLSKGQIAIDLGDDAEEDENAVVTLILNGADITCEVAPAIIFYNVYECGTADEETAAKDVDTSKAGANVIIADGTENTVNGSYVARIYKPDTVVLNDEGTEVEDAKKLHKYDAAFYSKKTMNVSGGKDGTGILNINAQNEGLDSELHLTINGGNININSGNDGINTNEDNISVTTINGGSIKIAVNGSTGEGDGIDSNGWLVINGGTVIAEACSKSADAGIDSDKGIHINGGTVIATGHMLDRIEDGGQTYAVFNFANEQDGTKDITLKNNTGEVIANYKGENSYSILIFSSPDLKAGEYTLWDGVEQLAHSGGMGGMMGMPGGMRPGGEPPEMPENGKNPFENGRKPEGFEPPEGGKRPEKPGGQFRPQNTDSAEATVGFNIAEGGNMFGGIAKAE